MRGFRQTQDDFFEKLRKEDEMKAWDRCVQGGEGAWHQEEREGWVLTPWIRTTTHAAMQPLQSPNVGVPPSTWSCPPTNSSPHTLPNFRPRAAAQKWQNTPPDPSEHPQTLSQPPLETFLDVPTDFFIPPLKPRPKPEPSLSQAWACCQGLARDVLKPEPTQAKPKPRLSSWAGPCTSLTLCGRHSKSWTSLKSLQKYVTLNLLSSDHELTQSSFSCD